MAPDRNEPLPETKPGADAHAPPTAAHQARQEIALERYRFLRTRARMIYRHTRSLLIGFWALISFVSVLLAALTVEGFICRLRGDSTPPLEGVVVAGAMGLVLALAALLLVVLIAQARMRHDD